ncbi:MAG: sugar transferase [bacterium]|nr:sugar transferase [bacterium]MDY3861872.1 sugar transferase [Ruminococcus sp.]
MILPYDKLPKRFQTEAVKPYYDILSKKKRSLFLKRVTDIVLCSILLVFLIIPMIIIALSVKVTSKGPVFYKQKRVTTYGRIFNILKFRTMVDGADKIGSLVTGNNDSRVTSVGKFLRKYRLDEIPQIFNVLSGKMSIVGTRPEVPKYVERYTDEMYATLLMPAGITSLASIKFKDEEKLLQSSENIDEDYVNKILPQKMRYNLKYISRFGFRRDLYLMLKTVKEVVS